MRSGAANVSDGFLRGAGQFNYNWSKSAGGVEYAYATRLIDSEIRPSHGPIARYLGFSLRCLQE